MNVNETQTRRFLGAKENKDRQFLVSLDEKLRGEIIPQFSTKVANLMTSLW